MKHTFSYPLFHPHPHQLTFLAQPFIFTVPYHTKTPKFIKKFWASNWRQPHKHSSKAGYWGGK